MSTIINITSQGQISIPAKVRELLGLTVPGKLLYKVQDNKVILEPVKNLLALEGVFGKKAIKNKSIEQIIAAENKAIEDFRGGKRD